MRLARRFYDAASNLLALAGYVLLFVGLVSFEVGYALVAGLRRRGRPA